MLDNIDPEVLEFLRTLPPDVQQLIVQRYLTNASQMQMSDPSNPAIFTPGDGGSTIVPRRGEMPNPALFEAFTKKRKSKIIMPKDYN